MTTRVHNDVCERIHALGVRIEYTRHLPPQRLGCYLDDERLILIRWSLSGPLEVETLAHEYIHARHRDRSRHPAIEWRAWREAAQLIIDPVEYARAERICDDPLWIAHELDTTTRIIEAYRKGIQRGEISLTRVA